MKRSKTVDEYIENAEHWNAELKRLRKILNGCDVEETVKWGAPCYTVDGKNVVGLGAFKSYVGLWFFQGALMKDPKKVLVNAQDGKTKALRQWRFASGTEIDARAVKAYVQEAAALQRAGKSVAPSRGKPVVVPPELEKALGKRKKTRAAFEALTPGKRREYADYVASAKREATRIARVDKVVPMIEAGVGLNDRYRNC